MIEFITSMNSQEVNFIVSNLSPNSDLYVASPYNISNWLKCIPVTRIKEMIEPKSN